MPFTKASKFLYSKTLFNILFLNEVGPLGRWSQERCADNCGPCGEYILTKLDLDKLNKAKTYKISSVSPHLMAEEQEQHQVKH